jgi:4-oxalocrotonate tautomerase
MPYLNLQICPVAGRAVDLPQLARTLTDLTAGLLRKNPDLTAVQIDLVPPEQWFLAGLSLARQHRQASFHLQVQVTAQTNTEAEIAAYLAAVHAALGEALGGVHPASYIVIEQLPAAHWGYGGLSQAQRYRK